jgi:hypothetical protein
MARTVAIEVARSTDARTLEAALAFAAVAPECAQS